ncbi:Rieske (2Fe-2S) protein [Nostoc sp. DSM 114160]
MAIFTRYCPYEGADLIAGYLRDQCLVCPWHNLPINLNDGASPCQSLPKLTILQSTAGIVENELDAEINEHNFS